MPEHARILEFRGDNLVSRYAFNYVLCFFTCLRIYLPSAVAQWLVHLSTISVVWIQSPAEAGLIFLTSTALGLTQPHRNGYHRISWVFWEGKEMRQVIATHSLHTPTVCQWTAFFLTYLNKNIYSICSSEIQFDHLCFFSLCPVSLQLVFFITSSLCDLWETEAIRDLSKCTVKAILYKPTKQC